MAMLRVGQTAIYVDDLDAAVKDFEYVFGIKFNIVDATFIRMKVAVSDYGIVLASRSTKDVPASIEPAWNGVLTAIEIQVDDIEETRKKMEELGSKVIYSMDSESGFHEHYMTKTHFHGLPITLFQIDGASWVEAIGAAGDEGPQPTVTWVNPFE
ncbi:MAG TPA: VOC family protein [Acidimicrobiales bacterium]|nr:VOC family protein [Acidimicrobiales bacterium]